MNKYACAALAFLLCVSGVMLFSGDAAAANASAPSAAVPPGQYYCPPGAKFCPVPGREDFSFENAGFGMDPWAEETVGRGGASNPPPEVTVSYGPEEVLYAQPGISPSGARDGRRSEVANRQSARAGGATGPVANDGDEDDEDRIPWWKGGMWRNRRREPGTESAREAPPPARTSSAQLPAPEDDDMWGDEPDAAGGFAGDPYAQPPGQEQPLYGAPPQQQSGFAGDPYAQPVQQPLYGAPPQQSGFVGEAYTLPNSPNPTSPYPAGYTYPAQSASGNVYSAPQTYAAPPQYASQPAPYADPLMQPPPAYPSAPQPIPPAPASSGPQFESAVAMVKDNRFPEAKAILLSETALNPGNSGAWRWLGDCHYNLLELQAAVDAYKRSLDLSPDDYYALRGLGFAHLHRGHELWRQMMMENQGDQKAQAVATFTAAHENYKQALDFLGQCLQKAPNDGEAIYGKAMAAEGASRKLYSNAISYLNMGPENRSRAELFAENCLQVINEGIDRARDRARQTPGESGPRALLGGLFLRKAILYNRLGKNELALTELKNAHSVQKSIIDEIDKNNATALKGVQECENYMREWTGGAGSL